MIRFTNKFIGPVFLLLLALAAPLLPRDYIFKDWVVPGDPGYNDLKQAAEENKESSWMLDRLRQGKPLPQASAREFANELMESPRVGAQARQKLKEDFPPEASQAGGSIPQMLSDTAGLRERLEALQPLLDQITAAKKKNNYSPLSSPKGQLGISAFAYAGNYRLMMPIDKNSVFQNQNSQYAYLAPGMYANTISLALNGISNGTTWDFYLAGFSLPYFVSPPGSGAKGPLWYGQGGSFVYNPPFTWDASAPVQIPGTWAPSYINTAMAGFNDFYFIAPTQYAKMEIGFENGLRIQLLENAYVSMGTILWAMPNLAGYDPFFANAVVKTEEVENPPPQSKSFTGLVFHRPGESDWWPFTDTWLYVAPSGGINGNTDKAIGQVHLRGLDLILLQDSDLFATALLSETNNSYDTPGWRTVYARSRDYAFGVNSQIITGGFLTAEGAVANWMGPGPNPREQISLQDMAFEMKLSQSFAHFSLIASGAYYGPYYASGGSGTLDTAVGDIRPGNDGKITWQTNAVTVGTIQSNSKMLTLQGSWNSFWTSFGLTAGFCTQIEPSGPWLAPARNLNVSDWFNVWGAEYGYVVPNAVGLNPGSNAARLAAFNKLTVGKALYNGVPVTKDNWGGPLNVPGQWNWDDLQCFGSWNFGEILLLSQNGLGDPNLRQDSVKTVNGIQASAKLDLQALMHTNLPFLIQGTGELRDTDESIHLARYTDGDLLSQAVCNGYLTIGLNDAVNLLGRVSYETWQAKSGCFPVSTQDDALGLGFDFILEKYLSGLTVGARYQWMDHWDANYPQRNFMGFAFNIGTNFSY